MSFRRLCLVACGLLFGAACNTPAEPVPPPPWIISKTIFRPEREWYVSQSIVDAPFFNQMGWMGQGTPAERIRWEVTRQYLIGYRSYPLYYSEDDRLSGLNDAKDPVIAYPILAHYDMFQGQMIQPPRVAWSELPYFSVDWSNPLLTEEGGGPFAVDRFLSYVVEDPQDPDFFFVRDDYIELKHFVSKDEVGVAADPATRGAICDDADFMVCQPSEFTIIRSMFPIDLLDDQYIPHLSPQSLYSFFPHFRKSHALVNPTGVVMEQGRRYFADRMNIWERVRDDNGAEIPWHRREARPVPWYILEGAPPFFHSPVQWAIEQWNDAILEGVNARRYYSCIDAGSSPNECLSHFDRQDTFLLFCPNNPVKAGDPEPCGEPGTRVKKGDLRYNTFTWDTDSTTGSAAGVGWFNVDHKTARIFSSQIYFNSYSLWKHCYTLAFFVKIMNGEISLEEIATSEPYADLIAPYFAIDSDRSAFEAFSNALQTGAHVGVPGTGGVVPERPLGPEEVERAVKRMSLDWLQSPTLPPVDKTSADTIRESVFRRLGAAAERGYLPAPREVQRARESLLHGSDHERAVTDEADFAAAGVSPSSPDSLAQASPLREHPRRLGSDYVVAEPVLGNPFDRTWFTFAQNHVGKTVDEIAEVILVEGLSPLVVHEIGHALGGRHNFAGSYDAMNYPPEYWSVRALDGSIGPRWEDPLTDAEVDAGLLGMQYSSVMDYFYSPFERARGLGHYDRALAKFLYAETVEVFNHPTARANAEILGDLAQWNASFFTNGFFTSGGVLKGFHYTDYPALVGDLEDRSDVPMEWFYDNTSERPRLALPDGRPMVPYRACSDQEYDMGFALCTANDRGADPYEKALDNAARSASAYWQENMTGGTARTEPAAANEFLKYFQTMTFVQLVNAAAVDDPAQLFQDKGMASSALAVELGVNTIGRLLVAPDPGGYDASPAALDQGRLLWQTSQLEGTAVVSLGEGRYSSTVVAGPLDGRTYLERVLVWGFTRNKRSMLDNLTLSLSVVPDGESLGDPRDVTASYAFIYPDQVLDLFGSILAADWESLGPSWDGTSLQYRRWSDLTDPAIASPVDPAIGYSVRRYLQTILFPRLKTGVFGGFSFADLARIVIVGSGGDFTTALAAVTFTDPFSGRSFRALSRVVDGRETGIGARMLLEAERLRSAAEDPLLSEAERADANLRLQAYVQEVDNMRQLSEMYAD